MCAYLGIKLPEPRATSKGSLGSWESHLVWIAKLAVLDELPDGWEEVVTVLDDETTRVQYIKKDNDNGDLVSGEHPNDDGYRAIIARERAKRPPKEVLFKDLYEYGPIRFRKENTTTNTPRPSTSTSMSMSSIEDHNGRSSSIIPALGLYMDLYDSTGTKYFYHVVSGMTTYDIDIVRREPAATLLQRAFRGHATRRSLRETLQSAKRIQSVWRNFKFRKALTAVTMSNSDAASIIQREWRNYTSCVKASRDAFRKLAELKEKRRPGRIDYSRVNALLNSNLPFRRVLHHVITVQRHVRYLKKKRDESKSDTENGNQMSSEKYSDGKKSVNGGDEAKNMMVENLRKDEERANKRAEERQVQENAAIMIQSHFRGMQGRMEAEELRKEKQHQEEEEEARREAEEVEAEKEAKAVVDSSANGDGSDAVNVEDGDERLNNNESLSGRATPLPERKIVAEMNAHRPKSRGKTPKYLNKGTKQDNGDEDDGTGGWSVGDDEEDASLPRPSKVEEGAEVLILGGDDEQNMSNGDVGDAINETNDELDSGDIREDGTGNDSTRQPDGVDREAAGAAGKSHDSIENKDKENEKTKRQTSKTSDNAKSDKSRKPSGKPVTNNKAKNTPSRKKDEANGSNRSSTKPKIEKTSKTKPYFAVNNVVDNTVSTRTKLKAPTPRKPTTPKSKTKKPVSAEEGKKKDEKKSGLFGRSTVIRNGSVKQIKIGSLFVSPIGAVKRTSTPERKSRIGAGNSSVKVSDEMDATYGSSRPKTPSKLRTSKKKLNLEGNAGNGDNGLADGDQTTTSGDGNENLLGMSISYPSPSSSRASSREQFSRKKRQNHKKKEDNGHSTADDASLDDNMDLFDKIKEQKQKTACLSEEMRKRSVHDDVGNNPSVVYGSRGFAKVSPTRRLKRI